MLDISKAIKIEKKQYGTSYTTIYTFKCSCCDNTIRSETKYLKKHTGKCRFCAHKGIPHLSTYNHFKDGVLRTNIKRNKQKEFNISFEEYIEFTKIDKCHYCNKNVNWQAHTGSGNYRYNLDRKDSNVGYIKDNLVVCCKECNYMKGAHFSYEEFIEVIKLLKIMRNKCE